MFRLALRNLWAYKRRLLTSGFAVVLGISFLSGSFIFTDTLKGLFSDLFSSAVKGVDGVVRSERAFEGDRGGGGNGPYGDGRSSLPINIVDQIKSVDGVAAANPAYQGYAQLINKKGKLVRTGGAPTFGYLWADDKELNAYKIFSGRPPQADNEVVLDRGLIKSSGYKVGDTVKINTNSPAAEFKVVGDATFGTSDSALGATGIFFTPKRGTELMGKAGEIQGVLVRAKPGVTEEQVVASIKTKVASLTSVSGAKLEVLTGTAYDKERQGFLNTVFGFINNFFTAFAVIALFVSVFVIANSFSIVMAQRNREMAMLRTIGAGRGQIMAATFVEALFVGVIASAIGLAAGVGVAALIRLLLGALGGGGLPSSGFKLLPRTIILGMGVGTFVTVGSAVLPALRASRVKPLAALRESTLDRSGTSKVRIVLGTLVLAISMGVLGWGLQGSGTPGAIKIGIATFFFLISTVFLGPILARPVAGTLGRRWYGFVIVIFGVLVTLGGVAAFIFTMIKQRSPAGISLGFSNLLVVLIGVYLVRTGLSSGSVSGRIARENSIRNPTRTSATALALTIGTAVVCGILVLSTSLTDTFKGVLEKSVKADYVVVSGSDNGFPKEAVDAVKGAPGLVSSSGSRRSSVRFVLRQATVGVIDSANIANLVQLGKVEGDFAALSQIDTIAIDQKSAKENNLKIGDTLNPRFTTGVTAKLKIVATYDNAEGFGNVYYLIDNKTGEKYDPSETENFLYVKSDGKDPKAFQKAVDKALEPFPSASLKTKSQFATDQIGQLQQFLAIIYALLLLAIIIAILGIANTLRLSIFERTREIGLLRAIGQGRDQTRAMIRWEAIVVATFGTVLGIAIGTGFGSALVHVLGKDGSVKLAVPWAQVGGLALLASIVGLFAARKPASDSAKLNILQAIATE
jgi:putative ABC transport system permease protein